MQFRCHAEPEMPPLAWACRYQPGTAQADFQSGAMVETRRDFLVEGAWDGSFAAGPNADSNLTGSGGRIAGAGLEIYQPFHTFQRLHLWRGENQLSVSNSLAFCLARYRTAARRPADDARLQRATAQD